MKNKKSIWASITGGLSSVLPVFFACCKGGACVGICVSPVASLFGVSAAAVAASPITAILEPLLIALSAVSFTISYYNLYVLPKLACATGNNCDCNTTGSPEKKLNFSKLLFLLSLVLSIGFITYFETSKYLSASAETCVSDSCDKNAAPGCTSSGQNQCCEGDTNTVCTASATSECCVEQEE